MKPDTTDPFADVLALNSLPYLPPDSLLPGLPLLDQMKFIVVPLIPNEWFEDVAALLGVPSPLKAQIVLENTREGTIRIGPPEDPTFQRYYALCSAIHSIHSTAFLQLSRSLHQNTERRHRIIGRFQEIQAAIKKLQDLLAGPVEMKEWEEWDLPVARRLLAESLDLGQGGDVAESELDRLVRLLREAHRKALSLEQEYRKGPGNTKNVAIQNLLRGLAAVYKGCTGRNPARALNSHPKEPEEQPQPCGKFYELVTKMYALLGPPYSEKTAYAVDKDIHRYVLSKPRKTSRTPK